MTIAEENKIKETLDVDMEETPAEEVVAEEVVEEKVEEEKKVEEKVEEPKDAEPDAEVSEDARYKDLVKINPLDGTLNVIVSHDKVVSAANLDSLSLVGAARANVGIVSGRYLFETEILQLFPQGGETRLGFSLADSSLFLGDKGTIAVSSNGTFIIDGVVVNQSDYKGRRLNKGDVVGLFINRTEDIGNPKTVSVFVNGLRQGKPQKIPESFDGALYPHVSVKSAIASVNFSKNIIRKLPFDARPIGDVSMSDISVSEIKEVTESEIVIPVGYDTKAVIDQYVSERPGENFTEISTEFVKKWQEKSAMKSGELRPDALAALQKLMGFRKRKYIYALGHFLLSEDRKTFLSHLPAQMKKTIIVDDEAIEKLPKTNSFYKDVTLPTNEEGWTEIKFTNSEQTSEETLVKFKTKCKNATKADNFKASDVVKTKVEQYLKFKAASKANVAKAKKEKEIAIKLMNGEHVPTDAEKEIEKIEEEKKEATKEEDKKEEDKIVPSTVDLTEFAEEDWMLADLRVELHAVCHAFRLDVEDKERTEFSLEFLPYYYKEYGTALSKTYNHGVYGCKNASEVLNLIQDTVKEVDGMAMPQHAEDVSFDTLLALVETQRQERVDRIGAGDEGAKLKFKANTRPVHRPNVNNRDNRAPQKGGNKGYNQGSYNRDNRGPVSRPAQSYGGKGSNYNMRAIPAAQGEKRQYPSGGQSYHSAPKRYR